MEKCSIAELVVAYQDLWSHAMVHHQVTIKDSLV